MMRRGRVPTLPHPVALSPPPTRAQAVPSSSPAGNERTGGPPHIAPADAQKNDRVIARAPADHGNTSMLRDQGHEGAQAERPASTVGGRLSRIRFQDHGRGGTARLHPDDARR